MHDLVLVPIVLTVGVTIRRLVPAAGQPWVGGGLLISGIVTLVAWPSVRGYGRLRDNPSILPRNYATGLTVTIAAVWAATVLLGLLARRRRRSA